MSEVKQETKTPLSVEGIKSKLTGLLQSWQLKAGLAIVVVFSLFLGWFFWQHWVAIWGMNAWAKKAGASPIECMIKDTNNDKYISCSAMMDSQVVPLECGANILNIGCRVNYGTAAPIRAKSS